MRLFDFLSPLPLITLILAHTNPKLPGSNPWAGLTPPGDEFPGFVGGAIPTRTLNGPITHDDNSDYEMHGKFAATSTDHDFENHLRRIFYANGTFRYREFVDGLNERAANRRGKGVLSPGPSENWDNENWHWPPTCDLSDEGTAVRIYHSSYANAIDNYLKLNHDTTITIQPGTWVSIGIKGFILWIYWGEDGHGDDGQPGSALTLPFTYIRKGIQDREACERTPLGTPNEKTGFIGWPFCVYDASGRPLEICGEKRLYMGKLVDHIYPGTMDASWTGTDW
ncbi:hypothetical protein HYFRA_00010956 [Hymenoscyphus fraxineus]|uniref:Uncharacterized protein n=1 Tax=Hymenoscyphus fraxineus TaxID=746836 RepID=A0A9N9KWL1_9HELO|nr:hypothetical protein HYFRA_00010956 [Hymenoscyphus fraxineus]